MGAGMSRPCFPWCPLFACDQPRGDPRLRPSWRGVRLVRRPCGTSAAHRWHHRHGGHLRRRDGQARGPPAGGGRRTSFAADVSTMRRSASPCWRRTDSSCRSTPPSVICSATTKITCWPRDSGVIGPVTNCKICFVAVGHRGAVSGRSRLLPRVGTPCLHPVSVAVVRGDDGTPLHLIAQIVDLSERRALEEELRAAASKDPLTVCPTAGPSCSI